MFTQMDSTERTETHVLSEMPFVDLVERKEGGEVKDEIKIINIPISDCEISRFNTRKTISEEDVKKLAERIQRIGFERTRAVWSTQNKNGKYEIFAGGHRIEAAKRIGMKTIPSVVYTDITDEEISNKADMDNENDEYHVPVSPVDVWAEYSRLSTEEKWTQEKIAKVKGVDRSLVARRIKLNTSPPKLKESVTQGNLTETHLREIVDSVTQVTMEPWLTTEQAWEELVEKALADKGKNGTKSVRQVADDVKKWNEFIEYANTLYETLEEKITFYDLSDEEPKEYTYSPKEEFVKELKEYEARTLTKVKDAERKVKREIADNIKLYQEYLATKTEEAENNVPEDNLFPDGIELENMDCLDYLQNITSNSIDLVLTDPPYEISRETGFQDMTDGVQRLGISMEFGEWDDPGKVNLEQTIKELFRVLKKGGTAIIFYDLWKITPLQEMMISAGFKQLRFIEWVKKNPVPINSKTNYLTNAREIALVGTKGAKPKFHSEYDKGIYSHPIYHSKHRFHPTQKPVELMCELIEKHSDKGDTILDVFLGSGTTVIAAIKKERLCKGCEIDPIMYNKMVERINNVH